MEKGEDIPDRGDHMCGPHVQRHSHGSIPDLL